MLNEILQYLHNWFSDPAERRIGTWTIEDGTLDLPFLAEGQYFRILGSTLNDGVYQYPTSDLTNETFDGAIWPLRIPPDLLSLVSDIEDWQAKYGTAVAAPYQSESFGGYSYSKTTSASDTGTGATWQDAFAGRLNGWRKI